MWLSAGSEEALRRAKKKVFSTVAAVKANARERVGQPPPARVLPDPKRRAMAQPKHKQTLADLLPPDPKDRLDRTG